LITKKTKSLKRTEVMKPTKYLRSVLPLVALAVLAIAATAPEPPAATALVAGPVLVNGHPASGTSLTLAGGDRLETGVRGGAILTLSRQDGLVLAENTAVTLVRRDDGVAAELNRGRVLVNSSHQRLRELRLAGQPVSIRGLPGTPRRYQVSRLPDATYVLARAGTVSIYDEGYATLTEVPEGRAATVRPEAEALAPPAVPAPQQRPAGAGARAGQISIVIPKDYIVRGPSTSEGKAGDEVQWKDLVKTEPRGRVRLNLDDGSILNVGSNSQLEVTQHNRQTQQTDLEMKYGRMRAQVVKLSRPGAKFEVKTSTAVCGVLGTDFYIEATPTSTRVIVFRGVVRVTPIAAGAVAGITVGAGQATTSTAGSTSAPASSTAAQVNSAMTATTASQSAAQAASSTAVSVTAAVVPPAASAAIAATVPYFTRVTPSPARP